MRLLVSNHNKEVRAHLVKEFGIFDDCCGVFAPTTVSPFIVEEPLQMVDLGDGNAFIPPGIYLVTRGLRGCISSHTLILKNQITGDEIYVYAGIVDESMNGNCVDWRGVKRHKARATTQKQTLEVRKMRTAR